jgi:hypothetical protein
MSPRLLVFSILAFAALAVAVACAPGADCYPGSELDYCTGNTLVRTMQCADDPGRSQDLGRTDCGYSACIIENSVSRQGRCAQPCKSNADCPLDQFCSLLQTSNDGRSVCEPSGTSFSDCDTDNPRSCTKGLECLVLHPVADASTDASTTLYQCDKTCTTNADCASWQICSAAVVTDAGAKTCSALDLSGTCDPTNPMSCPTGLTCQRDFFPPDGYDSEPLPVTYVCK